MSGATRAELFIHEGGQALRIPDELRLPGKEVRIEKRGRGLYIEPQMTEDELSELWHRLDVDFGSDFMAEGRQQPPMPPIKAIFD